MGQIKVKQLAVGGWLFVIVVIVIAMMADILPVGIDWQNTYRPATLAFLQGQSPFSVEIYYAAPWAVIPLIPFALLPYKLGRAGAFVLGLFAFGYIAHKLEAGKLTLTIFMLSAAVIGCLNNGNIEWMPLLGIVLPPQWGFILLAVKPQVGIGLGIYWAWTIWREKGFLQLARTLAPVSALMSLSFALYGFWFLRFEQTVAWSVDNTSLGWYGMAIGWVALVRAIGKRDPSLAMASSPLLAPYVLQFTWSAMLVHLLKRPVELLGAVVILWVPVLLRVLG